jgi:IS30 family transposase
MPVPMTAGSMTATSLTPALGNGPGGTVLAASRSTTSCARSCRDKRELEWSPEQIAAWLRLTHPDRTSWHVCHETIYRAIYRGGKAGLSRQLTKRLRTGRPLRKRRRRANQRTPRFVAPAVLIDRRPTVVETRARLGDWGGDLITGRINQSAIGTPVDRASHTSS